MGSGTRASGVGSPKFWGENVLFQANNTILFGKMHLEALSDYTF